MVSIRCYLRCLKGQLMVPRGSKYPIFKDSGSKSHTLNGFWDQSIKYWVLGPLGLDTAVNAQNVGLVRYRCSLRYVGVSDD